MTDAPTVGLALIARDEAETLPTLLASIEGAFDRVVLLDTGSVDPTQAVFTRWADAEQQRNPAFTWQIEDFDWCDDFAAARRTADMILLAGTVDDGMGEKTWPLVDWTCWADCDDELVGAQNLRAIAAQAPAQVAAFMADYAYAHDQHGNCVCTLKRERLVRAGHGHWQGRVHEAQDIDGACALLGPELVRWVHRKPGGKQPGDRNLRILHAWNESEPGNPRVLGYLGTETASRDQHEEAVGYYRQYLALKTSWDEERCQIHRKLSMSLLALEQPDEALTVALEALRVMPSWPDTYLSLAQATYHLREFDKSVEWAREALRRGQPDSMLILNPLDYTFQPRLALAGALGATGRIDEALQVGGEALRIVPDHPDLQRAMAGWRQHAKREATAETFAGCAELLIGHDEQLKALVMLEQACPYFAQDHPRIVALRSMLRERLAWVRDPGGYAEHYESGGSKPEDFVADDQVTPLCEQLPRAGFLAAGIRELAEAA